MNTDDDGGGGGGDDRYDVKVALMIPKRCAQTRGFPFYALTDFISRSVLKDLGLSMGNPRARSQTKDAKTPKARDTPKRTV